jgi:two-component system sensor histidine kinase VicK
MVNNLLELSRLNRYELPVTKLETDLKALIQNVLELMAEKTLRFGFAVEYNLENVTSFIDGEKIKQVIINLIDNAVKHSEGDKIVVKLWKEDMVHISISDNGKGIPKENIKYIAEPFYRLDKSRSRKLGGSGLGLSICRDIIDAHGGTLDINSVVGVGTTVTISLQP